MAVFDLADWIYPDIAQGRQPQYPAEINTDDEIGGRVLYFMAAQYGGIDLVAGQNLAPAPGTRAQSDHGIIYSFNGSQQQNLPINYPTGVSASRDIVVAARVRRTATQAGTPGQAFGIFDSTSQSGFGVGYDTSGNLGCGWLSTAGAGLTAYSASSLNVWSTVFVAIRAGLIFASWIDGAPATTSQGSSISGNTFAAKTLNEICIGAQHRSSGYLRQYKGDIEWAALLYYPADGTNFGFTDDDAKQLIKSDFPRSILRSPARNIFYIPAGGSAINLTISDALHAHSSESLGLSVADYLAIADSTHAHAADNVVLDTSSSTNLAVADSLHAHSSESLTLVTDSLLSIADSVHVHQSDNLSLSSAVFLSIADSVHAHLSDNVTLDTSNAITLTVQDSAHGHTSESLGLTLDTWLQIVDSLHAHLSDSVVLSAEETLSIANALHAHFSAVPTLILGGAVIYARAPAGSGPRILAAPGRRPANTQTQSRPVNTGGTRH